MKKIIVTLCLFIGLIILIIFMFAPFRWKAGFINPISQFARPNPTSTPPSSPAAPKTYQFDQSTDLKKELDSINPQVLDSDFVGQ